MFRIGLGHFPLQDLIAVLGRPRAQNLRISPRTTHSVAFWTCGCTAEQEGLARDYDWSPCENHHTRQVIRPAV